MITNVLEVDIRIIRNNIKILKEKANKNRSKKFFAVVKANAYGLGAVRIAKGVEDIVDMFCVATIEEAIELRELGIKKDILTFGYIHPDNYIKLNEYNLITTIYDYDIAKDINSLGMNIRAHIKIETGHNRLGFKYSEQSVKQIKDINDMENINIEGMFTHFSSADEKDSEYTFIQLEKFRKFTEALKYISKDWIKHVSNDAANIAYDFGYDAIRSGISMYGLYPSEYMDKEYDIGIKCSFLWKSKISYIKNIEKDESISYGRKFIAYKNMKVATVACGYADGYKRLISNNGYVLINGKKANILGTITMDQLMVDVTDINVKLHDDVILIGESGNEKISPYTFSSWAKTIPYEIMTSISSRVKRIYK